VSFLSQASTASQLAVYPLAEHAVPDTNLAHDILALRPALTAFARRLCGQECEAEDLVQDTLLRAFVGQHHFAPGTNLKSWLFTILRNSFNTRWRRSQREVTTGEEVIELSCVTPATQETILWARQALGRLLHDLSPAHRDILILIPVRGVSYEDAAQICGCSIGTVKSRLNRARAALAALVDEGST
jgi:RNA polymerase sigma factor (sigma-70 family)